MVDLQAAAHEPVLLREAFSEILNFSGLFLTAVRFKFPSLVQYDYDSQLKTDFSFALQNFGNCFQIFREEALTPCCSLIGEKHRASSPATKANGGNLAKGNGAVVAIQDVHDSVHES